MFCTNDILKIKFQCIWKWKMGEEEERREDGINQVSCELIVDSRLVITIQFTFFLC